MDSKTILVLTDKGNDEVSNKTSLLYGDAKRALSMVNGVATFAELSKRAAPSLRSVLAEQIRDLVHGGFIQDKARQGFAAKIVTPLKSVVSDGGELDFTTIMRAPSPEVLRAEGERLQAEKIKQETASKNAQADAENARRAEEHQARLKAMQQAKEKEQAEAQRVREQAQQQAAQEEKLKTEMAAKAKQEADAIRLKAEQEAAQIKQAAEQQAKAVAEAARVKAEQEANQRAQAEASARQAAEVARVKAEQEAQQAREEAARRERAQAEFARLKAEQEAEKARQAAEIAKRKADEEAKARDLAERRAKAETEKAKQDAEREAARVRAELDAAKAKLEAETKARVEVETKAKQDAEAARLKAEQDAAQARAEAEHAKQLAEQAAAQARAETERVKREAEAARLKAEHEAAQAKAAAEAARLEAETKLRLEAETKAKQAAEAVRLEAEAKATQAADAARLKAEQDAAQARAEAERVRVELENAQLKVEQENRARLEAEAARLAAEQAALQARMLVQASAQEQLYAQQLLQQQARDEEQKRVRQQALSSASVKLRDTVALLKLDDIDADALTVKPLVPPAPIVEKIVAAAPLVSPPSDVPVVDAKAKEDAFKEQIRLAEQQRIADEEAAHKLAETQAKAWADAEQRAVQEAKAYVNHLTHQQADSHAKVAEKPHIKSRRKSIPWGGIAIGLVVLAALSVVLVPMLMPTQEYAHKLEVMLGEKLQQPVHIGKLSMRIVPTPRLDLGEVYIGEIKQFKANQAQLNFGFGSLFSAVKRVETLDLQGAEFNGKGLLDVPVWIEKLSGDNAYPIAHIVLNGAKINGEGVQINNIDGSLNFSAAGQFSNAALRAEAGKYALDIKPNGDGKLEANLQLHNAALPLLPSWNFIDLTAKGILTRDDFTIGDWDSHIAEGGLQGNAKLSWQSGWSAQGSISAKSVSLAKLNKLLEGDMDGAARFHMQSDSLAGLSDSSTLDGSFVAKKGVLNGVDVVETARLRSKENLPGGRTHFDQIESAMNYANGAYHFKGMKISNSVLSSNANIDVIKQQLSGRIAAHLSITEGMGTADLVVGGTTDSPTLHAGR